jgi:hypothetical protein
MSGVYQLLPILNPHRDNSKIISENHIFEFFDIRFDLFRENLVALLLLNEKLLLHITCIWTFDVHDGDADERFRQAATSTKT